MERKTVITVGQVVGVLDKLRSGVWKCKSIGNNTFKVVCTCLAATPTDNTLKKLFNKYGYDLTIWTTANFFKGSGEYSFTVEQKRG